MARWHQAVPHFHEDKPGGTTGERDRLRNPGFQHWEIKFQNLWLKKSVGVVVAGETPSLTGEFIGETHRVLECTQNHAPGNQHQKCQICLWVVGEVTESLLRPEQVALFPLWPLPHIQHHNTATWIAPSGEYLRLCPLLHNRCAKTKKKKNTHTHTHIYIYIPSERTDQSSRKNATQQRRDSQPIRCSSKNW